MVLLLEKLGIWYKKNKNCIPIYTGLTHSYTIQPVISDDGRLLYLFLCLQETIGVFQNKGHFQAQNIYATAHISIIMTKNYMSKWFRKVYFT